MEKESLNISMILKQSNFLNSIIETNNTIYKLKYNLEELFTELGGDKNSIIETSHTIYELKNNFDELCTKLENVENNFNSNYAIRCECGNIYSDVYKVTFSEKYDDISYELYNKYYCSINCPFSPSNKNFYKYVGVKPDNSL